MQPLHGSVVLNPNGNFTYTPNPGYSGIDIFKYKVCDDGIPQACDTVLMTIDILANDNENDTYANDDSGVGLENNPILGNLLINDNDPEGNLTTVVTIPFVLPMNGTVTLSPNGDYVYVPDLNFSGNDEFVYVKCDNGSHVACDTATVYLTIIPVNEILAKNDVNQTPINTPVSGQVLTNDSDPEGDNLTVKTVPYVLPSHGTVVLNANGTYTYTPTTGFTGTDVFEYIVCDDGLPQACDTARVDITVFGFNDPNNNQVIGIDDHVQTLVNNPVTSCMVCNDSDPDFDILTVSTTPVALPMHGSVVIHPNGIYTYTPNTDFVGEDEFYYKVCDDGIPQRCDTVLVTIDILEDQGVNTTFANDDATLTSKGMAVSGNVLSNDADLEGDNRFVNTTPLVAPMHGMVTLSANGNFVYTPNPGYVGNDQFVYIVCDDGTPVACDTATVYLSIIPERFVPIIGNFVWEDKDGDGQFDAGEPGIAGVQVKLKNASGAIVATTVTDGTGHYQFNNVIAGNYYLEFCPDTSIYKATFGNVGNDNTDSDMNGAFGLNTTQLFTFTAGQSYTNIWAGFYKCIFIGEWVWYDTDYDDFKDPQENGINGLVVKLFRKNANGVFELFATTLTAHKPGTPSDDGYWMFCAPPGTYYIDFDIPPYGLVPVVKDAQGFIALTNPNEQITDSDVNGQGISDQFTIKSGDEIDNIAAGYYPMASIGNLVWYDQNLNGIQDAGEPRVGGVHVEAFTSQGQLYDETYTDQAGIYNIDYLQRDGYFLRFTPPVGYAFTVSDEGNELIDSDINNSNGARTTPTYYLNPGENYVNVDAGLILGVLPVDWLNVSVNRQPDNSHLVTWVTASEVNCDHYEVERKGPKDSEFIRISEVKANGSVNTNSAYQSIDFDTEHNGTYFYRIKQLDIDGRYDYSKTVEVRVHNGENNVRLSPNPAYDKTNLELNLIGNEDAIIAILDNTGKLVKTIDVTADHRGGIDKIITIDNLSAGVYLVRISQGSYQNIIKLIIID